MAAGRKNATMAVNFRRSSLEPRIELTPLLDVIFLLLIFFIYALVLTVEAEVLPVRLPSLGSAEAAERAEIAAITLDADGDIFLNREPVTRDELEATLRDLALQPNPPQVFVAISEEGNVDRGPAFVQLVDLVRQAGFEQVNIVGQPGN